jgi:hypothetical protein
MFFKRLKMKVSTKFRTLIIYDNQVVMKECLDLESSILQSSRSPYEN